MATFNGTAGNDTLIGGAAADDLHGFGGNDFLQGGDGTDTVLGDAGNDTLSGNGGNDWVRGGTGNDQVSGGGGQDTFAFHDFGTANADTLTDFSGSWDHIGLDVNAFTALGSSLGDFATGDARFRLGAAAQDADDRIIYDQATGRLWYDADGNGAGAAQLIATLSNRPAMSARDIFTFQSATPPPPPPGTINGTAGNDTIMGTEGPDTINGLGGDDSLLGGGGVDSISGGDGNDTLTGHDGFREFENTADTLDGGLGDDHYIVSRGDVIAADPGGVDTVFVEGSWTLGAGLDNLVIQGVEADGSSAFGNELNNVIDMDGVEHYGTIEGRGGNDLLLAGQRSLGGEVLGGDGNDTIQASTTADDTLRGGAGNDLIVGFDSFRENAAPDTMDGGAGNDTLDGTGDFLFSVAPGAANADTIVAFRSGWDNIVLEGTVHANAGANGRVNTGDARFFAGAAAHDADDRIIYNQSTGQLWYDADGTGAGAQQLIARLSAGTTLIDSDIVIVNSPGSTINGTSGNDSLVGTGANDTINGFAGNDTIDGRGGDDSMVGGTGDDLYFVDGDDIVVEAENGGIDTVRSGLITYTLPDWVNNLIVTGNGRTGFGNDIDNVLTANVEGSNLWGMGGNDLLQGGDFSGIHGWSGGDGNDTLRGGSHSVSMTGDAGNDVLEVTGEHSDSMTGGAGADDFVFTGVAGDDFFADSINDFTSGVDELRFDGRAFTQLGASGDFTAGDARFHAAAGATSAHDADDRVVFNTSTGQVFYDADGSGGAAARLIVTLQGSATLAATDIAVDNGTGTPPPPPPPADGTNGTEGNDTMVGTAASDTLNGLGGNDFMQGQGSGDTLRGGAGNDTIGGNDGVDWIEGGAGNDRLTGGSATDAFIFREFGAANADVITEFGGGNWDSLRMDNAAFTTIGADGRFASGDARFFAGAAAHDADDRIVWNSGTGQVWYDADGNGAGAAQLVATLQAGATLVASDIWVI